MAGLHARFSSNHDKGFVYVEFMAGKSNHESVNTLSVGRLGFNLRYKHIAAGANVGALYMGLGDGGGIIQNVDNYEYTSGVELRYIF